MRPEQADGYAARGYIRTTAGFDWTGAEADLAKAVALDPGDSTIQRRYGELLASIGRMPEAIASTRKAIELDPLSEPAWQTLEQYSSRNAILRPPMKQIAVRSRSIPNPRTH